MGLLDHYRQFAEQTPAESSRELRERAAARRRHELERVDTLDLSALTCPEPPHAAIVNAITFAARRGLQRQLEPHAGELRSELAHRLGVPAARVVVGHGVAQLMAAAATALLAPGDELVTPWPSHPLLPALARRARATAVPVRADRPDREAVLRAVTARTRVLTLCNPNDPTGAWLDEAALDALLGALPERVAVLLDEALVEYAPAGATGLLASHPRLLLFRTFSKAWGLAGLRIGYAVGGEGTEPLLEELEPALGVGELARAGALEALRSTDAHVRRRAAAVGAERVRLSGELRALGLDVAPSEANLLWIGAGRLDGAELVRRLERAGVRVADGARFGDPRRIRVAVQTPPSGERLLEAMAAALR